MKALDGEARELRRANDILRTASDWVDWFSHPRLIEPIGDALAGEGRRVRSATRVGHGGRTHKPKFPGFLGRCMVYRRTRK